MIGVVVSEADVASTTIGDRLRERTDWTDSLDESRSPSAGGGRYFERPGFELRTFEDLHIHLDRPADAFDDPAFVVFASRHAGETGPLLTAHFTGNFGAAEYGGEPAQLATACPNAQAAVLESLAAHAPAEYEVGMECTHHGPSTVGAPSMFVEIGSGDDQWRDRSAADAVANAILELADVAPLGDRTVVGFGGGHYVPRFERIVRETDWAVGHVGADWCLDAMDDDSVLEQAFEQSGAERALLDGDHPHLAATIATLGYDVVTETWLRETSDVPLELATRLESELEPVEAGLRFGTLATEADSSTPVEVVRPDPALLSALAGIDAAQTRDLVADRTLAFETAESGNVVDGLLAVPDQQTYEQLVDGLCTVLEDGYETVERTDDAIAVTERRFDPERAAELGVPEGPEFGKLAAGESVEVDGRTVEPDAIHERRRITYRLRV